jgi:hypothetical protein
MVNIQLKAKHFYAIADIQFGIAAYASFSNLEKIKVACQNLQDDDLATVETSVDDFLNSFSILSSKPEGMYNMINTEMMDLLIPQIQTGVDNDDPEWIILQTRVQAIRNSNWAVVDNAISSAKNRLYN